MATVPEGHRQILAAHTVSDESPEAVYNERNRTVAVTDSRLIIVETRSRQRREEATVQTVSLAHVVGVSVEVVGAERPDTGTVVLAGILGLGGFLALVATPFLGGLVQLAVGGGASVSLFLAFLAAYVAFDTDDGAVSLVVLTPTGNADYSFHLPEERADFAATVNARAGRAGLQSSVSD